MDWAKFWAILLTKLIWSPCSTAAFCLSVPTFQFYKSHFSEAKKNLGQKHFRQTATKKSVSLEQGDQK
jgi:putative heme iron utilization protein